VSAPLRVTGRDRLFPDLPDFVPKKKQEQMGDEVKILVTGATGLIGSAVCARLKGDGHRIAGVVRPGGLRQRNQLLDEIVEIDIAKAVRPDDWESHLSGTDAVVNCAGVLQESPRDSPQGVHAFGADALFAACVSRNVRRVIHFSAIGVDRGGLSDFSRSKFAGDQALMARDLDWVILRPSVVLGRAVFGASALFRGLAALRFVPETPDTGKLQVVQLDEVVETVAFFLEPGAPSQVAVELAGPERLEFREIVAEYRHWLGWPPARVVGLSGILSNLTYRIGDLVSMLGWRPAMRTTAQREIARGAVGDPAEWRRLTGIEPRSLRESLRAEPASVQERWFAKLYFLKPVTFVVFAAFWIGTGIISLGPGWDLGVRLMEEAGAGFLSAPGVIAGALADIAIGIAIAYRPTARWGLYGALALSAFYLVMGTILMPVLWSDPIGPMLKILPIMVLNLVALAILEER
jgi:uncharacterized protein YbjT (DUF2867 family)